MSSVPARVSFQPSLEVGLAEVGAEFDFLLTPSWSGCQAVHSCPIGTWWFICWPHPLRDAHLLPGTVWVLASLALRLRWVQNCCLSQDCRQDPSLPQPREWLWIRWPPEPLSQPDWVEIVLFCRHGEWWWRPRQAAAGTPLEEPVSLLPLPTQTWLSASSHACLSSCHHNPSGTGSSAAVSKVSGSFGMARLVLTLVSVESIVLNTDTQAHTFTLCQVDSWICGRWGERGLWQVWL